MKPYNICIDLDKYCAVSQRKTLEYYATLLENWQKVSQHREQQMPYNENGIEITCYKLSFDKLTNCYRLTDEAVTINSSNLSGAPVQISK